MITITNDFHHTQTRVDETRPLTKRRISAIKRRLCVPGCTCSDTLGSRGSDQAGGAWAALLERAECVMLSGKDEQ
jgi:hypothetical protein